MVVSMTSTEKAALAGYAGHLPVFGTDDPAGVGSYYRELLRGKARPIQYGQIIIYNPQAKMASVRCENETLNCFFTDDNTAQSFGYSFDTPPREGDFVLVYPFSDIPNRGVVIGRIPYQWNTSVGDAFNDPENYHRRSFVCDLDDTDSSQINGYSLPLSDRRYFTQIFNQFRPTDVFSGEMACLNQHNCGLKGGFFSFALHGGGAIIRLSALTNSIRESCEHYMRFSMAATTHEFHNGRYLSCERNVSMFQEERLGWRSPDNRGVMESNVWTKDSESPRAGLRQTARPRIKELSGFFGNLYSRFCMRPDPNDAGLRKIDASARPKEEGVSRETIDPSGQYRISAAGMLTIERTGRIPVPVRIALPTDKGHDIDKTPQTQKPFQHESGRPGNRILELYDRQAYDLKSQYSRVDGSGFEPDYYVPQESDLRPLTDKYAEAFLKDDETVKLAEYDKRRAGIYIGEDGSVIIRDAWGSEIDMLGGNVVVSCAGNIINTPGRTSLTIAGDDIVCKAQNSIDMHASEHDVRLSASRNMEIIGGADEKNHQGGVVIESRGRHRDPWDGDGKGEDARLNGITLKATNQNIVTDCNGLKLTSSDNICMASGKDGSDGTVKVSAKNIIARASGSVRVMSEGGTNIVSEGVAKFVGSRVLLSGTNGATVKRGMEYMVPLMWRDTGVNDAESSIASEEEDTNSMKDLKGSTGYGRDDLDKMMFGFRSSEECGTMSPWEIGAPHEDGFYLYEPAWVQMLKKFETLNRVYTKVYSEKGEWGNGKPFPGLKAEDSAKYIKLKEEDGPANISSGGYNENRDKVKDHTDKTTSTTLKSDYVIRQG